MSCSAIAVHTRSMSRCDVVGPQSHAPLAPSIEALGLAAVLRGEAHVMEHGAGIERSRSNGKCAAGRSARQAVDPARMIEKQIRLGIADPVIRRQSLLSGCRYSDRAGGMVRGIMLPAVIVLVWLLARG